MRREKIQRSLLARRDSLLQRRRESLMDAQELYSAQEPDPVDVATDVTIARVVERLSDAELMQLQRIGLALARLEDGTYGTCALCGEPIPRARLSVVPEADRCAACSNSH
jgi:RNA polymerase-binding protein DksA